MLSGGPYAGADPTRSFNGKVNGGLIPGSKTLETFAPAFSPKTHILMSFIQKYRSFWALFLALSLSIAVVSCSDDDDDDNGPADNNGQNDTITNTDTVTNTDTITVNENLEVDVTSNITSDRTFSGDSVYILATRVSVTNGATLTIEPGSVIKGNPGSGVNATALVIAKDGQIQANGTASQPIIFTSVADKIQPSDIDAGNFGSPNLSATNNGLWGGVIVLGDAPISADAPTIQIEGIPANDQTGQYGGSNPSHSSGSIEYISIRHGGSNIGEGNEINGLTLGGVGTGTTVSHVEIVANQDDGLECFGGTVDVSNVLVWNQGDDAFDMDQAYSGTVDNFIGVLFGGSDHALELDGPEGSATGTYTLRNGTLVGAGPNEDGPAYADLRDGALTNLNNLYFTNFSSAADFQLDGGDDDTKSSDAVINGNTNFSGLEFNTSQSLSDIFDDTTPGQDAFSTVQPSSFASVVSQPTVGANPDAFSFTWAAQATNNFADLGL